MTRWKKDETEFVVSLFINKSRGSMCVVPKPIVDLLGEPKSLTFIVKNGRVTVEAHGKIPA
ncbi:MAG: hypothetical protein F4Y82_00015 [Cenarchaeum sp. SB0665_bin_23]|nr:hypothetical protein [Cenarchaeum sp. SB0667_bin_13]MXY60494.1 hypothetical protein [Cenarchaeum sp. SB0665_bin_23]MXZ93009.1 hypothetical protein [Cenarchaeum sp. SB0666_bin_15]MYB46930.1 hypothetical protein [Cenarchaeum sp. SB0662_bin_33]MYC79781.1 hypothetical protein [Cenarchaeum sp. SB0661_bin_35]MYD59255.1 hypothetical protein [Cenarchaeum sp. SB0678_bin_8]MYG33149.1 hypothetical protein [Cenarchaeum sp. SB0677_bin_16]